MNKVLANAVKDAIEQVPNSPEEGHWYPTESGRCQEFIRLVVQGRYGNKYDKYWDTSAKKTAVNFMEDGIYVVKAKSWKDTQLGDIIYKLKGSGGFGHVGIRSWDSVIGENSSTKIGRVRGALGYRTFSQFSNGFLRDELIVVRLPE